MEIVVAGVERVDTSWVVGKYWNHKGFERGSGCATRSIFQGKTEKRHEDLLLQQGNACTYHLSFRLPKKLPPSFRGRTVQYYYSIHAHATVQENESHVVTAVAYMPIVLKVDEMGAEEGLESLSLQNGSNRVQYDVGLEVAVNVDEPVVNAMFARGHMGDGVEDPVGVIHSHSNLTGQSYPRVHNGSLPVVGSLMHGSGSRQIDSPVSSLMHTLLVPEQKQPSYNLRVGESPFARFSIHPPRSVCGQHDICLGNNLAGFLDFRVASRQVISGSEEKVRCVGVTVTLESREEVSQEWVAGYTSSDSAVFHRVHCELSESTVDTVVTNILLTVPKYVTPSFSTDLIQHSWLLRFRFAVLKNDTEEPEEVHWALPVRIGPHQTGSIITNPGTHASLQDAMQVSREVTLKS